MDRVAQRLKYLEKRTAKTRLKPRVVTTQKMFNKTVTTPKIAENAVTTETIAANAVTTTEIAPGAVTTAQINFDAGDIGGMASSVTTTAPTSPNVGDIWFDASDNNNLKRWSGTAWVSVRDATIAVAQSAANAAQTTADGKNKIYRQATSPGTTGNAVGDLWFDTANDNRISRWDGSAWTAYGLGNAAIANLDAGKITTGSLDAGRIAANTINASMIIANSITSNKIAADAIDGKTITGATLQTSNTVNGKIIIDSTNGFRAIASNGATTVTITTGGTASFTGGITATSFTATNLVSSNDLQANSVTSTQIATSAVGATEIADLAIGNAKISDLSASKINAGTIDASVISVTNLNASNITVGTINAAAIAVTNLNASNITAGSINAAAISVTNINASNITTGTITGRTFQSDSIATGSTRTMTLVGSGTPSLKMYDSIGDTVELSAVSGLFMKYGSLAVSTKINLVDTVHRVAIDTTNATYALEVGGSIRCTSDLRVGGSIIGGGVLTSPLGASINANGFSFTNVNEVQADNGGPADPSFTFSNSTDTGLYYDGDLNLAVAGISRAYATSTGFSGGVGGFRSVNPNANTTYTLGISTARWSSGYVTGGLISSSDMRIKNNIQTSNLGLDFIEKLRPVSYRMNQGAADVQYDDTGKEKLDSEGNVVVIRKPGSRPHYGFIAQEVKQVIDDLGVDFAGWTQDDLSDPNSYHSLRYDEFISPAIKAIQELSAKVKTLEARIVELEG